jgi:ATP-dependent DNA helicase RecG
MRCSRKAVDYKRPALAVVDEQHRFGVHQRLAITAKGDAPDMLVMTATPIPRTLVLTAFGDMDVSRLTEKPAGPQPDHAPSRCRWNGWTNWLARIRDAVAEGQKIYWICPLVEESDEIKLMSAEDRFAALKPVFGDALGLVHGRMKGAEKDEAMRAFKAGETRVLVATTVIEVGVDVPDATIIVIEHAERFGLAQLHQLRGRVGRGDKAVVLRAALQGPARRNGKRRLSVMRETEDGFRHRRGRPETARRRRVAGHAPVRHAGLPGRAHRVPRRHAGNRARRCTTAAARAIRNLQSPRGEAMRMLLYLFGRDEAVRLLRAG